MDALVAYIKSIKVVYPAVEWRITLNGKVQDDDDDDDDDDNKTTEPNKPDPNNARHVNASFVVLTSIVLPSFLYRFFSLIQ